MIEIKKRFFTKFDRDEEIKLTNPDLYSEAACKRIAAIYGNEIFKWTGHGAFFLSERLALAKREKRIAQIKKLITIISDLGVTADVYISVLFDELLPFLKEVRGLDHVPFANLLSKNAIKRFKESSSSKKKSQSLITINIRKAVEDSAGEICSRFNVLLKFDKLNEQAAINEVEVMVQSGIISDIYIFTSPFTLNGKSQYLDEVWMRADKKLNGFEKKEAMRAKAEFLKKVDDERIAKYV